MSKATKSGNRSLVKDYTTLIGKHFNRLMVLGKDHKAKIIRLVCMCRCLNIKSVAQNRLIRGEVKSCGCLQNEMRKTMNITHGLTKNRTRPDLYRTWSNIKTRCYNPNWDHYEYYGGRGIKVCDEWLDDYVAFQKWALDNGWSKGLQIDREDNDGDYSPDNCRWVTAKVNSSNRGGKFE